MEKLELYGLLNPMMLAVMAASLFVFFFYSWKKQLLGNVENDRGEAEGENEVSKADLHDEIRALRKQLARAERDVEILKKAALILGDLPQNGMSR